MNNKLAIIGAGEGALPIINKAKEKGMTIVAYGRNDSSLAICGGFSFNLKKWVKK